MTSSVHSMGYRGIQKAPPTPHASSSYKAVQFGPPEDPFETNGLVCAFAHYEVHRCKLLHRSDTRFAVKIIVIEASENTKKAKAQAERKIQSLRREIRNMRELHHPKIVNIQG